MIMDSWPNGKALLSGGVWQRLSVRVWPGSHTNFFFGFSDGNILNLIFDMVYRIDVCIRSAFRLTGLSGLCVSRPLLTNFKLL